MQNFRALTILLIFTFATLFCKPPELTSRDAKSKIEEIIGAHINYDRLVEGPERLVFAKKILNEYLNLLDPSKSYFLKPEIAKWLEPSDLESEQIFLGLTEGRFDTFVDIHQYVLSAITRRRDIEKRLAMIPLPTDVESSEFEELAFVEDEEALFQRVLRIRAMQLDLSEKLQFDSRERFAERLAKSRLSREDDLIGGSDQEREQHILANVIKAVCHSLDTHTSFFTPQEAAQFLISAQQRLFGIGAELRDDLNGFKIMRLLEGGPAMRSGVLREGDRIIAVDNEPIVGYDIIDAVALIRGPKSSQATLKILRESEGESTTFDLEITRDEIVLEDLRYDAKEAPFGEGMIGIIDLHAFYQDPTNSSADDIRAVIEKWKKEKQLLGVILNMRNNAGGLLTQAVAVCGLFMEQGIVVSVKDNAGKVQHLRNFEREPVWTGPLMILTNCATASAAEIVAGTLQDYGRALVVGDKYSYGKGTYQSFTLDVSNNATINPQGEYKVTRGIYYTVSGRSPQLTGNEVDIEMPGPLSEMQIGERFDRNPVPNDQIAPHFIDDLSDVHPLQRARLRTFYQKNMQKQSEALKPLIPKLTSNSAQRIELNKNYQKFLEYAKNPELRGSVDDVYAFSDLQEEEAINTMKDLIVLSGS